MTATRRSARTRAYFTGGAYGPRDAAVHREVMTWLRQASPAELAKLIERSAPPESRPAREKRVAKKRAARRAG